MQKQNSKIKKLEDELAEKTARLERAEEIYKRSEQESAALRGKLSSAVAKLDEIDNGDEHVILRKQLDSLLKEKTNLCIENSELKIKLAKYESVDQYPTNSSKKHPTTDSSQKTPKRAAPEYQSNTSPLSKSIDTLAVPLSEEDSELRNKVISYFSKKYPDLQVVQVTKSRLRSSDTFEFDCKKLTFRLSNGVLTIKTGGGFLPCNQYFSLHPVMPEKETNPASKQSSRKTSADRRADREEAELAQANSKSNIRPTASKSPVQKKK